MRHILPNRFTRQHSRIISPTSDRPVNVAMSHPSARYSHPVRTPLLGGWRINQYRYPYYQEDVYGVLRSKDNGIIYSFNKKSPFKSPLSIDRLSYSGYNVSRFSSVLINCRVLVS